MGNGVKTTNLQKESRLDSILGNLNGSAALISSDALITMVNGRLGPSLETLSQLQSDLDWPDGAVAAVWNDQNTGKRGIYVKSGASGSGSWNRSGDLPVSSLAQSVLNNKVSRDEFQAAIADAATSTSAIAAGNVAAGDWDASSGSFPSGALRGTFYNVSAAGSVDSQAFVVGDRLYPVINGADTQTYLGNWSRVNVSALLPRLFANPTELFASTAPQRGSGARWETADGHTYIEAASDATDALDVQGDGTTTAGGVKLYVNLSIEGSLNWEAVGVSEGSSDNKVAMERAIALAASFYNRADVTRPRGGARITGRPGASYAFSGRLRLTSGVSLFLGVFPNGSQLLATSDDGGIEQEGGTDLIANIVADSAGAVGPILEINDTKTSQRINKGDLRTMFDVNLFGRRQAGLVGLRIISDKTAPLGQPGNTDGISWMRGKAYIRECDDAIEIRANNNGYVNSNAFEFVVFDAVNGLTEKLTGTMGGEIAANNIIYTHQTGEDGRNFRVLETDAIDSTYLIKSWDHLGDKLDPASDQVQVIFTEKSGGNTARGSVRRKAPNGPPAWIDRSTTVFQNYIMLHDLRVGVAAQHAIPPVSYAQRRATVVDNTDFLAHAVQRFRNEVRPGTSVTTGGSTPPSGSELIKLFTSLPDRMRVQNCTDMNVTVDFGKNISSSEFGSVLVVFYSENGKPDRCRIQGSQDGASWTTILECGYRGEPMPDVLDRYDSSLTKMQFIRLICENDAPRDLSVVRWAMTAHGLEAIGGAFAPTWRPELHGRVELWTEGVNDGFWIDGKKVIGPRLPAIASGLTLEQKVEAIIERMEDQGIIEQP